MNAKDGNDGWWGFLRLCLALKTTKQLDEVLDLLLTIDEKEAIATRYQIIKGLLEQEETQRDLASNLKVSIAKITRGSNALKRIGENLKKLLLNKMT